MLAESPSLLHASYNWGGSDWESALGAAAHVGRKDIALYLLEKGARMDIFAAAMLGELEVVQAILVAQPEALRASGTWYFSTSTCTNGWRKAQRVFDYLTVLS